VPTFLTLLLIGLIVAPKYRHILQGGQSIQICGLALLLPNIAAHPRRKVFRLLQHLMVEQEGMGELPQIQPHVPSPILLSKAKVEIKAIYVRDYT
jgi:hypothetical protein